VERGQHAEAEALAREAVALIRRTDALNFQAAALYDLAEVLTRASCADEAEAAFAGALECYERKKNIAGASNSRARFKALRAQIPAI
jgi:hypothetical protein